MENGCLEKNFIFVPHPWPLPVNTSLSLVLSAFLPSLAPAPSPCEQKLARNLLSLPTVCPIFLDLSFFIVGRSMFLLANGHHNLSVTTRTSNCWVELERDFWWKNVKRAYLRLSLFFPRSVSDSLVVQFRLKKATIINCALFHCAVFVFVFCVLFLFYIFFHYISVIIVHL